MSDLSWLNPTPHAIAVYASPPLSPAATQHSLPSGRYSLLGPDFHRLDRTSFAWRTHSITSSARASSVGDSSRPSAFAVLRLMTSSYLVGACSARLSLQCGRDHRGWRNDYLGLEGTLHSPMHSGSRSGHCVPLTSQILAWPV